MQNDDFQKKAEKISAIHATFMKKLYDLKKKKLKIVELFLKKVEQRRIDEIRKSLKLD